MKVRDIIKVIEKDGWFLVSIEGDHRQYKHPYKLGRVTVPGHPSKDVAVWNTGKHLQPSPNQKEKVTCIAFQ